MKVTPEHPLPLVHIDGKGNELTVTLGSQVEMVEVSPDGTVSVLGGHYSTGVPARITSAPGGGLFDKETSERRLDTSRAYVAAAVAQGIPVTQSSASGE